MIIMAVLDAPIVRKHRPVAVKVDVVSCADGEPTHQQIVVHALMQFSTSFVSWIR